MGGVAKVDSRAAKPITRRAPAPAAGPSISEIRKRLAGQRHFRPAAVPGPVLKPSVRSPGAVTLSGKRPQQLPHRGSASATGRTLHRATPAVHAQARARFSDRHKAGEFNRLTSGTVARQFNLAEQYRALHKGDVARRLDLRKNLPGGVHSGRPGGLHHRGLISPHYAKSSFAFHYYGPRHFAGPRWYPRWSQWVNWSWHHRSHPIYDPRPTWCRPVIYRPCPQWVTWHTPVWISLPVVSCGTWVDVAPIVVASRFDLQLLAVRFVDPGHPEEKLGPRYRIWLRNNSDRPITQPFNVMLFAGDQRLTEEVPQSGVRVTTIEAGDTQSVDVRLPIEALASGRDAQGKPAPFAMLHVLVDAHREVPETTRANNGARIPRQDVLPVDPAAFEVQPVKAAAGAQIVLAGEGFGPQPGQLLVHMAGLELQGEILGWYDLGVRATLPAVPLAAAVEAELIVIRGDGAAANPIKITITPRPAGPALVPPQQ